MQKMVLIYVSFMCKVISVKIENFNSGREGNTILDVPCKTYSTLIRI